MVAKYGSEDAGWPVQITAGSQETLVEVWRSGPIWRQRSSGSSSRGIRSSGIAFIEASHYPETIL
jgi:hypothetical protein